MSDEQQTGPQTQLQPITGRKYLRVKGNPALEGAVIAKFAAGQSKTSIANDLGVHRNVIANVLNEGEIQQYIDYGRNRAVSLIPRSLDVAEKRLDKCDGSMAIAILRGTKVLQNESVTVNTQNNFAFALQALKQETADQALDRPATPQVIDAQPVLDQPKPAKPKRINKRKLS